MADPTDIDVRQDQIGAALRAAVNAIEWLDRVLPPAGTPDPDNVAYFDGFACCACLYQCAEHDGHNVNTIKGAFRALGIRYVRQRPHWINTAQTVQCTCQWGVVR